MTTPIGASRGPEYVICGKCGAQNLRFVMLCRKYGHRLVHVKNKPTPGKK